MGTSNAVRQCLIVFCLTLFSGGAALADTNYSLRSPDNRIDVAIHVAKKNHLRRFP